jgi:hypothetical protein
MGIEMKRVELAIPYIDIKDGTTSSTVPGAPNPRMFAKT